ncbi:MAG TPA: hypothetical protein VMW72_06045 [Sedimentisphaerales bacterium]|nr:hypothetical protein [Sedimentisphaerales bacterium]
MELNFYYAGLDLTMTLSKEKPGLFQFVPFFHTVADTFLQPMFFILFTCAEASAAYFFAAHFKFGGWPLLSRFSLCVCNLPIRRLFLRRILHSWRTFSGRGFCEMSPPQLRPPFYLLHSMTVVDLLSCLVDSDLQSMTGHYFF